MRILNTFFFPMFSTNSSFEEQVYSLELMTLLLIFIAFCLINLRASEVLVKILLSETRIEIIFNEVGLISIRGVSYVTSPF